MKPVRFAAALTALSLALAACGGGSSSNSTSSTTTDAGTSTPAAQTGGSAGGGSTGGGSTATPVDVTLADFSISIAGGTTLDPGAYTFTVSNTGQTGHNLTIEGPGVNEAATSTFTSGTQQLSVTLKDGKYEFFCSVPGHKEAGMDVDVTVGSG
jgi:plastocyanin